MNVILILGVLLSLGFSIKATWLYRTVHLVLVLLAISMRLTVLYLK